MSKNFFSKPWTHLQGRYCWVFDSHQLPPHSSNRAACYHPHLSLNSWGQSSQPQLLDLSGHLSTKGGLSTLNAGKPQASSCLSQISAIPTVHRALLLPLPAETSRTFLPLQTLPRFSSFVQIWLKKQSSPQAISYNSLPQPRISPKWVGGGVQSEGQNGNEKIPLVPFHILTFLLFYSCLPSYFHACSCNLKYIRQRE